MMNGVNSYNIIKQDTKKIRSRACDICHLRKIKCNNDKPQCTNCGKHNVPCTYLIAKGDLPTRKNTNKILNNDLFKKDLISETNNHFIGQNYEINGGMILYKDVYEMSINTQMTKTRSVDALTESFKNLYFEEEMKLFVDNNGSNIYLGNSPMGFYVSSKNAIIPQDYHRITPTSKKFVTKNERKIMNFKDEIQKELVLKLIDIYFKQINNYQSLVNKLDFYTRFKNARPNQYDFWALLNAICLSGCGHFHHKSVAPILGNLFQYRIDYYLKKCYLNPTTLTVQTLTLLCQYIGTHPNDEYSKKGWYYLMLAKRHALLLGLNYHTKLISKKDLEIRKRIWFTLFIDDRIFGLCVGKPRCINNKSTSISVPSFNKELDFTFINFEANIVNQCHQLNVELNFFISYIKYCKILGKLLYLFNGYKIDKVKFKPKLIRMEQCFHNWYFCLPSNLFLNKRKGFITVPYEKDSYSCILHIYYLSILVEINRPLVEEDQELNIELINGINNGIDINIYNKQNFNTKCSIATKLGSQIISNMGLGFVLQSPAYKWWCLMNFVYILSGNLEQYSIESNEIFFTNNRNLFLCLSQLAQEGGQRWPMVKQIAIMVSNLLKAINL